MEDRCWDRLGIDPTADTAAIKKAYARQLKFNKPDKNPEGFRDLRAAYEQALDESYWYVDDDFVEDDFVEEAHLVTTDATNVISVEDDVEDDSPIDWYNNTPIDDTYDDNGDNATNAENEQSAESEVDLEEAEVVHFFFESSPWTEEWERAVEDTDTAPNSDDERLQALLQTQLNTARSLDEQKDFEEALLIWFTEKPPTLALSYHLVKTHFRWDKRLEHWSHNHYPWYRLESLNHDYQYVTYFRSLYAFSGYLTQNFPIVASYLTLDILHELIYEYAKPTNLKRIDVFKRLFFPFKVIDLAKELRVLGAELDYHIYEHPAASQLALTDTDVNSDTLSARYWRQDSAFNLLYDWILNRFIKFEDFGLIALTIAAALTFFSLLSEKPWLSFYHDGIGVFVVISLYYLFWQLQLRLFATPEKFVSYEPWANGWRNASILLFILGYISWLDISKLDSIGIPTSPVYFLTHLAGASLFAANSIRQSNFVIKAVSWHAGVLILVLAVFIPLFVMTLEQPPYNILIVLPISPLFWLLLAAPAFLIRLSETYPRLGWIDDVGYTLLTIWHWLMLVGGAILLIYCANTLPKMEFGFTAITIFLIAIIMTLNIAVILDAFKEES